MEPIMEVIRFIWANVYLRFLVIVLISFAAAFLAKFITKKVFKPLAKRTKTRVDDLVVKSISSIIFYAVFVIGLKIGLQQFEMRTSLFSNIIDTFLIILISFLIFKIIDNFADHWMTEWADKTESTADDRLIPLFEKVVKAVVVALAVIFVFSAWGINISPLLATAGIAGLAIGFAVKDSLANILGGIQLVLDKTFKVGDKVEIESGEQGVILDIGLRTTKLQTYDNEVIYIPNGYLANAKIKNFSMPDVSLRVNVFFGVEYGSDPEKVREVVMEAVKRIDTVLDEPEPQIQFQKMSDFSLDFVARAWVKNYTEGYSTRLKMTDEIYAALGKANIGIPFPTRKILTKSLD